MIKGTGIDIVDIGRIERLIEKYGRHFLAKVFSEKEIRYCEAQARPAVHFAGRWAAKEAFYKALTSSSQAQATWQAIEVLPGASNRRPSIAVRSPALAQRLAAENIGAMHVSISHERNYCTAIVVME
jgi:holo-[acyl-carrier protein] synthase